jgi:hypothetical protein
MTTRKKPEEMLNKDGSNPVAGAATDEHEEPLCNANLDANADQSQASMTLEEFRKLVGVPQGMPLLSVDEQAQRPSESEQKASAEQSQGPMTLEQFRKLLGVTGGVTLLSVDEEDPG